MFGIEPGEDIEETANTGESYRYCDVTDAVVDFWVTGLMLKQIIVFRQYT